MRMLEYLSVKGIKDPEEHPTKRAEKRNLAKSNQGTALIREKIDQ